MDTIDRILLDAIQADGRRPLTQLADLDRPVEFGRQRAAAPPRRRRHAGRHARRVDPRRAGFDVCAFVEVLLAAPGDDTGFIAGCLGEPQVQECHHVTGDWSYLLKVRARHTADLERLIGHTIKTWPGVVRTRTTLALSSPKETAALPCAAAA